MGWREFITAIFRRPAQGKTPDDPPQSPMPPVTSTPKGPDIRRHFYNETRFQTYGSFFKHWGGWITAGHVLSSASGLVPDFAKGEITNWPGGLDAALIGCTRPNTAPRPPYVGQHIIVKGYPAGSRHIESRRAQVYLERETGRWIAHITAPDEPVVTGMSGGAVIDAQSGKAIGILITRNSPADLDADLDADQSCDFIALSAVWEHYDSATLIA